MARSTLSSCMQGRWRLWTRCFVGAWLIRPVSCSWISHSHPLLPPPAPQPLSLSLSLILSLALSFSLSLSLSPSLFLFLYLSLSLSLALCFSHRWQETMETSCPCSCLKPFILYLSCLRAVGELKIVQDPEVWWSRNNVTTRTRCQSSLFLPERQSSWGNTGGRRLWQ